MQINWHSFQLDPDFPTGVSIPAADYLAQRKGYPMDQINAIQAQLTTQAKQYGVDFQFDKSLSFNTMDVHRLWQWSAQFNKSTELKAASLTSYESDIDKTSDKFNFSNLITINFILLIIILITLFE